MTSPGNLKAHLFDLADQDREALSLIRECAELDSNALAVRLSIRALAKKLSPLARNKDTKKKGGKIEIQIVDLKNPYIQELLTNLAEEGLEFTIREVTNESDK